MIQRVKMPLRRRVAIIVLIVFGLIAMYYGVSVGIGSATVETQQVIAHRGGAAHGPENTMAAFEQAVRDGADWIEFDVRMSSDGELVVMHDPTVDRTTDGSGTVAALTLAELEALDAGNGQHVPTFAQVVTFAKSAGVGILPEAKAPNIEAAMVETIRQHGYEDRTIIQSFDPATLQTLHRLAPEIQLCAVYGQGVLRLPADQPGDARFVCPMAEMVIINPGMIRSAHATGREVLVWFGALESRLFMRTVLALGADGVIVDDPRTIRAMVEEG
jgi:glycerophosphoryl diester phosphodiesterase